MKPLSSPEAKPGRILHALLFLALVAPSFIMTAMAAVLPMMAQDLGGGIQGEILAQRAQALPFLGLALGGLLAGPMITLLGLRRGLYVGLLLYAGGGVVAGTAVSPMTLLPSCFLIGLAASLINAGLSTATGAIFTGSERTRILGFQTAMSDLAAIGSSIVVAALAQFFGWRAAFVIYPLFGATVLLLMAFSRLPTIRRDETISNGVTAVLRAAWPVYLSAGAIFLMVGTQSSLLPFHLMEKGLTTPGSRSIVLTATPLFAMLASAAYGLVRGRLADRWMMLLATISSVIGYAGIAFWQSGMVPIVLAATATGIGTGLAFPMVIRAAFNRVVPELHGYSTGLLTSSVFLGAFLSPILLGPVMRMAGVNTLFLLCAGAWAVIGLLIFAWMQRRHRLAAETASLSAMR